MFESAELGHEIDKATYAAAEPELRSALLKAQYELAENKRFAFVILINGVDGAGKGARFDLRAFNDAVLETGSVPLQALEARMKDWLAAQPGRSAGSRP